MAASATKSAERFLTYGDTISVLSDEGQQLYVDGSLKHYCRLLPQWDVQQGAMGELRKGLFRIEPQMSYKAVYRRLVDRSLDPDLLHTTVLDRPLQSLSATPDTTAIKLQEARQAALAEAKANETQMQRLRGKPVFYGTIVQLININTQKFVCVDTREPCETDPSVARIGASKYLGKEAFFRILPKFRIRGEGEPVRMSDSVIFQAVRTDTFLAIAVPRIIPTYTVVDEDAGGVAGVGGAAGMDAMSSPAAQPNAFTTGFLEACASSVSQAWTMRLFSGAAANPEATSRFIRKGMFIRLYHKEMEGYVTSAPTILAPDTPPILGQQVQLSTYFFDPLNPIESTSSLTFWQIEAEDAFRGGPVEWRQPIRLRHAVTGLYLKVIQSDESAPLSRPGSRAGRRSRSPGRDDEGDSSANGDGTSGNEEVDDDEYSIDSLESSGPRFLIALTDTIATDEDEADSTLFEMVQVNVEATQIAAGGFVRIRNIASDTWLHAVESKRSLHHRSSADDDMSNPGLMPVSSLHLRRAMSNKHHITASVALHPQDYFSLSIVETDLTMRLGFVQGMIPTLLDFVVKERPVTVDDSSVFPISKQEEQSIQNILTALIYFCTQSDNHDPLTRVGSPELLNQTLLRESGVIQILMWIVQIPFSVETRMDIRQLLIPSSFADQQQQLGSEFFATDNGMHVNDHGFSMMTPQVSIGMVRSSSESHGILSPTHATPSVSFPPRTFSTSSNTHGRIHPREMRVTVSDIKSGRERQVIQLLRFIYRLLKQFLLGSDEDNQMHVATHFDILAEQLDLKLGAADTLMQLISENRMIVQSIGEIQIQRFVRLLVLERDPSFVDFLVALCYCNGAAVRKHQIFIANYLFGRTSDLRSESVSFVPETGQPFPGGVSSLFNIRVTDAGAVEVEMPSKKFKSVWIPLHMLFDEDSDDSSDSGSDRTEYIETSVSALMSGQRASPNPRSPRSTVADDSRVQLVDYSRVSREQTAIFFRAVLRLFEALCVGQNTMCASTLTTELGVVSLDMCRICIFDERLPDNVRAAFADLCRGWSARVVLSSQMAYVSLLTRWQTVIYLDKFSQSPVVADYVFPISVIERPPTLEKTLKENVLKGDVVDLEEFRPISTWIVEYLPQASADYNAFGESSANSELVLSSLRVLRFLVSYGFYRNVNSIEHLLDSLIGILDSNYQTKGLKTDGADRATPTIRPLGAPPLRESSPPESDEPDKAAALILQQRYAATEQNRTLILSKIEACHIVEMFLALRVQMRVVSFLHLWKKYKASAGADMLENNPFGDTHELLSDLFKKTRYFDLNQRLTGVLLDLLRYQSTELKKSTLRLLHRLHSSTEELVSFLGSTLLVCDQRHQRIYNWIKRTKIRFIDPGTSFILADLDRHHGDAPTAERIVPGLFKSLSDIALLCLSESHLVDAGAGVAASDDSADTLAAGSQTQQEADYERVQGPPESLLTGGHPDRTTQLMLRNIGIHSQVLAIIEYKVMVAREKAVREATARGESVSSSASNRRASFSPSLADLHSRDPTSSFRSASSFHSTASTLSPTSPGDMLLLSCFQFLRAFARKNRDHQQLVFGQLDLLIEALHPTRSACHRDTLAKCLRLLGDFLNENVALCLKVRDTQIRRILEFSGGRREEYIILLRKIIKVEGKVLKRNQNLVLRLCMERRDAYVPTDRLYFIFHDVLREAGIDNDDGAEFPRSNLAASIPQIHTSFVSGSLHESMASIDPQPTTPQPPPQVVVERSPLPETPFRGADPSRLKLSLAAVVAASQAGALQSPGSAPASGPGLSFPTPDDYRPRRLSSVSDGASRGSQAGGKRDVSHLRVDIESAPGPPSAGEATGGQASSSHRRSTRRRRSQYDLRLNYTFEFIDMLALCAEEKNGMMQSICQNVLSFDVIMAVLNSGHKDASYPLRRSLVRFMVSVFVNGSNGHLGDMSSHRNLHQNPAVVRFLDEIASLLSLYHRLIANGMTPDHEQEQFLFNGCLVFLAVFYNECVPLDVTTDPACVQLVDMSNHLVNTLLPIVMDWNNAVDGAETLTDVQKRNRKRIINAVWALSHGCGFYGDYDITDLEETLNTAEAFLRNDAALGVVSATGLMRMPSRGLQRMSSITSLRQDSVVGRSPLSAAPAPAVPVTTEDMNRALQAYVASMSRDKGITLLLEEEFRDLASLFCLDLDTLNLATLETNQAAIMIKSLIDRLFKVVQSGQLRSSQQPIDGRHDTPLARRWAASRTSRRDGDMISLGASVSSDLSYDVRTLRVLEYQVREKIMQLNETERVQDPVAWQRLESKKRLLQNTMNALGGTLMCERLLTSDFDGIMGPALETLIVLLDGGNKAVQQKLQDRWFSIRDERFFYCMHQQIKYGITHLRETKQLLVYNARKQERKVGRMRVRAFGSSESLHARVLRLKTSRPSFNRRETVGSRERPAIDLQGSLPSASVAGKPDAASDGSDSRGSGSSLNIASHAQGGVAGSGSIADGEYRNIRSTMRLMQLIVEGHNLVLQDYLRHQPDNVKSFDLVKDTVEYLQALVPLATEQTIPLMIQVFDTLIDFAQGCPGNQVDIFNCKVIQPVNQIIGEKFDCFPRLLVAPLKGRAILTLLSLLEDDTDNETHMIFTEMIKSLDLDRVLKNMTDIYYEFQSLIDPEGYHRVGDVDNDSELGDSSEAEPFGSVGKPKSRGKRESKTAKKQDEGSASAADSKNHEIFVQEGFGYCMLIMTLWTYMDEAKREAFSQSEALDWFKSNTGRIEIVREHQSNHEKRLYRVLFPIPSICKSNIRKDTKDRFLWAHKRESPQQKIEDFVNQSQDIIFEIRNQARVADSQFLRRLAKNYVVWWSGAYILTFMLNILNLSCIAAPADEATPVAGSTCSIWMEVLRIFLGLLHLAFWSLSAAQFVIVELPMIVNRRELARVVAEKQQRRKGRVRSTWWAPEKEPETAEEEQADPGKLLLSQVWTYAREPIALYHAGMLLLSVLGLWYPALYAIHLLDFLYRDEVLQGVVASVTLNWSSLSKTALLGVIIVYIYSVIGFVFFRHAIDGDSGLYCDSLLACFITVLNHAVRAGGGIGDLLGVPAAGESYAARITLELSFFLIVVVFLLNVIFGIIFDTFGQIREEHNETEADLKSSCFICSIHASEFQRHADGFEFHVRHEHNIWHYLFFLVHLSTKDVTEYTSHESYVADKLAEHDLSFFPINRALALKRREIEDMADQLRKMEERATSLANVNDALLFGFGASHGLESDLGALGGKGTAWTSVAHGIPLKPMPLVYAKHADHAAGHAAAATNGHGNGHGNGHSNGHAMQRQFSQSTAMGLAQTPLAGGAEILPSRARAGASVSPVRPGKESSLESAGPPKNAAISRVATSSVPRRISVNIHVPVRASDRGRRSSMAATVLKNTVVLQSPVSSQGSPTPGPQDLPLPSDLGRATFPPAGPLGGGGGGGGREAAGTRTDSPAPLLQLPQPLLQLPAHGHGGQVSPMQPSPGPLLSPLYGSGGLLSPLPGGPRLQPPVSVIGGSSPSTGPSGSPSGSGAGAGPAAAQGPPPSAGMLVVPGAKQERRSILKKPAEE
nr:hypothetical protein HK105_002785 [Polyrhizophydium stewartii]